MAIGHGLQSCTRLDDCGVPKRPEAFSDVVCIRGSGFTRIRICPGSTVTTSGLPAKIGSHSFSLVVWHMHAKVSDVVRRTHDVANRQCKIDSAVGFHITQFILHDCALQLLASRDITDKCFGSQTFRVPCIGRQYYGFTLTGSNHNGGRCRLQNDENLSQGLCKEWTCSKERI